MDRIKDNSSMDNVIMKLELEDPVITTMETTLTKTPTTSDPDDKYASMIIDDKYALKTKSLDKYTLHVRSHDSSEIPVMKGTAMRKQTAIREEPISVIKKKDLVGWRKLMFKPRNKNPPPSLTESDSSSYTQSTSISDITPSSSVWYDRSHINIINEKEEPSSEEEHSDDIGSSFAELIVDFISCAFCDMDVYDDGTSVYSGSSIPRVVKFRTYNSSRRKR